jgi:caffeoyl-CoA O-methyltransferase
MKGNEMKKTFFNVVAVCSGLLVLSGGVMVSVLAQGSQIPTAQDAKIQSFLDESRVRWHDLNVPYEDGKVLYTLIIKGDYKNALEIGTSTGHSAIWIAWALSKTGGKLITIEINEGRYKTALRNFNGIGLAGLIDARLADAHQLARELKGPFDFVFSDADKEWYTQYFKEVDPKLVVGGCFTAHNVTDSFSGIKEFLDYIERLPNYQTTIDHSSSSGISISYKKSN